MHVLLAASGSGGDVLPLIPWARHMQMRGHDVTMLGNGAYAGAAEAVSVPFVSVFDAGEDARRTAIRTRSRLKSITGLENLIDDIQPFYRELLLRYRPGETVIAAHVLCLGTRLLQDRWNLPLATFHISPLGLRSPHDPTAWPEWMPSWMYGMAARRIGGALDRRLGPAIRQYRAQLDLPPMVQPVIRWMQSPQLVIGLWPEWFARLQIDHPPELRLVGFPLPDPEEAPPLPPVLEDFLAAGPPPLVFSNTTAAKAGNDFYGEGVKLTLALGARGVLLAPREISIPEPLPPNIVRFTSAPHVRLYPRAALAVHHGGVGTAAAAFAAGVPQFIVPEIADHPEVARRAKAVGVADSAPPRQFQAARVVDRVRALLASPVVRTRCAEIQEQSRSMHAFEDATQLLEDLAERHEVGGAHPTRGTARRSGTGSDLMATEAPVKRTA